MAILLYTVSGLHPRRWQMGATPRQPGSLDRKAWSHLGYCLDVEVGIDASNLVYNLTWAAIVWFLGLGAPWNDKQLSVSCDSLPPLPHM
eukprot:7792183-Pyramimonas_sp.AAC.1